MTKEKTDFTALAMEVASLASCLRELGRGRAHDFDQDATGAMEHLSESIEASADLISRSINQLAASIDHAVASLKEWKV